MNARRAACGAWIAGGIGMIGTAAGWIVEPSDFPHAWLAALTLWIGWPLGSMALLLIHALTGGRWGWAIRPQLAAGTMTLLLLPPAMVPLLFVLHALYPWMQPQVAAGLSNRFYLNMPSFYGRGAAYGVIWIGIGAATLWALRRDDAGALLRRIAPPALILLAITITFAAYDYTLSMEPKFKSSVYGMLVGTEGVLFALSIAVAWAALSQPPGRSQAMQDLGRLMLGLLVLWAYLDFMQLLIIWQSDLADEAGWYQRRITNGWMGVAAATAALHFVLPFFALLWPQIQRDRRVMGAVALLLVAIEIPRAWWIVIPDSGRGLGLSAGLAVLAIAGLSAGLALAAPRLAARPGAAAQHV